MTLVVLCGAGIAAGVLFFARAIRPRPMSVGALMSIMSGAGSASNPATLRDWRELVGGAVASRVTGGPLDSSCLRSDLSLAGMSLEELAADMVLAGVGAGLAIPAAWVVMAAGGIEVPWALPALVTFIAAGAGVCAPWLSLRQRALQLRRQLRRALGTYLELVSLEMAGAMGVEGALKGAAGISDDFAFLRIRSAIEAAHHRGHPPWQALGELGEELSVPELVELAANIGLAGSEGARVRETLSSKAGTLRRRELAEAEAEANSTTEKMFVPGVVLLTGFMIFVGYPAVAHVFSSL